jgi:hypothetical protein
MKDIFEGNAKELIYGYLETTNITYTFLNINNIQAKRYYPGNRHPNNIYMVLDCFALRKVGDSANLGTVTHILPDVNYFPSIPKDEPLFDTLNYFEYKGIRFCRYITPFAEEECFDVVVARSTQIEELVRTVLADSKAKTDAELNYPIIHSQFDEVKKHTIDFLLDEHFRQYCETKFIKHKRGLIFEGLPGGGKSTCLKWLKKEAEKANIKFRIFDGPQDFAENKDEYANDDKKIFVFEDFDAFIQERKVGEDAQNPNTLLSMILNTIDGINETNNTITVFTTNLIRSFDSAMIRPGRIDKVFSFELPSNKDIKDFYNAYLKDAELVETTYSATLELKDGINISYAILKGICDDIHIQSYYSDGSLSEFQIMDIVKEKLQSSAKGKTPKKLEDYLL